MLRKTILISFAILLLTSCQNELQRVDLYKNPAPSIAVDCNRDEQIDFYLDCDIEFSELPEMVMDFEFYRGEAQILKGGLDPMQANPRENETKTTINGITHWKFYGKLEGNFIPKADTTFTIKPTVIMNAHPNLKINKFELVLVR